MSARSSPRLPTSALWSPARSSTPKPNASPRHRSDHYRRDRAEHHAVHRQQRDRRRLRPRRSAFRTTSSRSGSTPTSSIGVLNAFDISTSTASSTCSRPRRCRFGAYHVFMTETVGDMEIAFVISKGDVSLTSLGGGLVDANNGGLGNDSADVIGDTIDLGAVGDIGARDGTNDLEINSLRLPHRRRERHRQHPCDRDVRLRERRAAPLISAPTTPSSERPAASSASPPIRFTVHRVRRGLQPAPRRRGPSSSRTRRKSSGMASSGRRWAPSSCGSATRRHHRRQLDHPRRSPDRRRTTGGSRAPSEYAASFEQHRDRPDRSERPLRHGHAPRPDRARRHAEAAAGLPSPRSTATTRPTSSTSTRRIGGKTRAYAHVVRRGAAEFPDRAASTRLAATSSSSTSCRR